MQLNEIPLFANLYWGQNTRVLFHILQHHRNGTTVENKILSGRIDEMANHVKKEVITFCRMYDITQDFISTL